MVEVEASDRRAAGGRGAVDFARFDIDRKMFAPTLLTRMEQRHFFTAEFVKGGDPVALVQSARAAGQG
jgi:hypothetical protein